MNVDWINGATQKELDQFKSVCNQLLSRTYLVKTLCRADKVRINNPDYLFLSSHYAEVREYLALLDWDLHVRLEYNEDEWVLVCHENPIPIKYVTQVNL